MKNSSNKTAVRGGSSSVNTSRFGSGVQTAEPAMIRPNNYSDVVTGSESNLERLKGQVHRLAEIANEAGIYPILNKSEGCETPAPQGTLAKLLRTGSQQFEVQDDLETIITALGEAFAAR